MMSKEQAADLEIELDAGDAFGGAGDLEVHIAVVIFLADDVGEEFLAVAFFDEADGDAGDGSNDGNAGIEKGEGAGADGGHRGTAVGFHDVADEADDIGEDVGRGEDGFEGAFG